MNQNFKRKLMAGLLSACMIFQTAGIVPVYAAENAMDSSLPIGTSSVCTHHVHDDKCGYTEGTPCNHVHTDECSAEVTKCVHAHTAECYPVQDSGEATGSETKVPTACTHICSVESGCITKELACKHVHNAECGYIEGTPCTFDPATCESCKAKNTVDNIVPLAVGEVYAVYDGSKFCMATAEAPTVPTAAEITNKNTINHLYVMGASVPEKLIGDPNSDDNTNLKTVTCADSVTSIAENAFAYCTILASVDVSKVTTIGNHAFLGCAKLTSVAMPSATTIGVGAFKGCANLTSVTMLSATTIGVEAFMSCVRLKSVAMPKVTTIGDSAFNDCTALASLTLGATPPTVGTDAFYKCSKTYALTIQGNTAIQDTVLAAYKTAADGDTTDDKWWGWTLPNTISESYAVYDGSSKKFYAATQTDQTTPTTTEITDKKTINHLYIMGASIPDKLMGEYDNLCLNLKTVTCADTVTTIGNRAFFSCKGLTNISLPSATTIGSEAFYGCNGLTSVALPSATTIGSEAFSDCKGLESIVLQRATKIGRLTFSGCSTLTSLTLGATPPTTVGTNAFMNCPTSRTLTIQGNPDFLGTVIADYKAVADGDTADNLWYGWTLPTLLDGTGVSNSAGTLAVTTGNSNPTFGAENTITLTATFDKAAKTGKQMALTINQVQFKDGANTLGTIATATQNDKGKWVATLNVNTKDWALGAHKLTAAFAGNHELGGSTTNEVTVTVNESYAVYDGSKFWRATKEKSSTVTAEEIADKKTINHLYIMAAIVPDELMLNCTTLKTVICANTVTSIGNNAFKGCTSLASVKMPKVTSIGEGAFSGCISLTSVEMPDATNIGVGAFSGCTALASVAMPNATTISASAFSGCTSLASAAMPSATTIDNYAFYNCTKLASLTIGATPPTVGKEAFAGCQKTNALTIQGNPAFKDTVLADYKAVADDNTTDEKWYGWALPTTLNGTGVSTSAGRLTAAGNVTVDYGTANTITFTASFAKAAKIGKQRTLAINEVEFKDGATSLGTATATKNSDSKWAAIFDVNTKDWAAGTHTLTATFAGNHELLGGSTTNEVTVTIGKADQAALNIGGVPNKTYGDSTFPLSTTGGSGTGDVTYAVTAGNAVSVVESTGVVTMLKAGTATITATKAGGTNYNDATATTTITVNAAVPTIAWADATETLSYTGSVAWITKMPTVTLVNGEPFHGTIQYAYKETGLFSLFTGYTDGLPTAAGEYTIKAYVAAEGNYTEAESTNTLALTISRANNSINNRSTTSMYYGESFHIEYSIVNTDTTQPTFTCEYKERSANDNTYTTTLPTNAGNYTMRVSATETQNYNACSVAQDFEIKKVPLNVAAGTAEPKKWDGTKTATVTGLTFQNQITSTPLVGDEALVMGTDFIVTNAEYAIANVNMNIIYATVALQNTTKANNYFLPSENGGVFPFEGSPIALADGPAAPAFSAMDDEKGTDTFTFNSTGATVYEYSKDSGATWTDITASGATTAITVGNIALVAGALQVRVKATATHNASGVLANTAKQVFTASIDGSVAITGTATYGETLTATANGTQAGSVLSYKWLAETIELQSGTSNTLKVPGSAVGKTITVEVTATGYNGNLTSSDTSAVAKKAVTATAGTVSKVYDGTAAVETADRTLTITKVNAGDDITITAANAVYNNANVNTGKAITLGALSISGAAADWYTVTAPTNVTGTITVKPVTVKADDKSMTTGGTLPAFTVTYTGFVGMENNSNAALTIPAVAVCSADGKTAGTFDITLSTQAALNDTIGKNYTIASQTKGTLTVSSPSSGGGTVTPPVPKPEPPKTDPGTGNTEVSVPVKPVTKGDTSSATVPETAVSDAIAAAEKEAAKTGGSSSVTVTVDAPEGAKTVETTLSGKSLSAVAEGKTEGLKISTPVADLSFDSEALKNIAGMAGKDVKISATQVDTKALTDTQKSQVGDAPVFDFTISSGDKTISNFNGGTATVSVPYTPKEGENPEFVTVWLLDDAGKLIPIEAKYTDGKIAFETGHFSRYAIGYLPFTDVKADWAYESIVYAYQNQLFSGVGNDKFAPTANMNRAMLWTVLYRMAGSPGKTETPANWYADAQAWAIANGISDGTNPDGNITREQLATILFRYAKAAATAADMSGFTDTNEISSFAKDGMSWAVKSKILQGNCGKLEPQGNATRAEVAAVLSRYVELVIDKATA